MAASLRSIVHAVRSRFLAISQSGGSFYTLSRALHLPAQALPPHGLRQRFRNSRRSKTGSPS